MTELKQAYAAARKKAFQHYENFPVASLLLPQPQRNAIAAVYAFARQADDFADEPQYEGRRLALLKGWLAELGRKKPSRAELIALQDAIKRHAIPKKLFQDLISAFSQDCRVRRYPDFKSVLSYCKRSANPVGRLVLRIFGEDSRMALEESDAICTALQLANFWQDLASDAQTRDRIYLPLDEMKRFGVSEADLKQGKFSNQLRELLRFQVNRTEAYFAHGEGLCQRAKGRLSVELRLTLLGGRRILEKIRAQGYNTLSQRPKLGLGDAPALLWRLATGKLA